jgi:2-methylcitrate dehydratase PrpD
MTGTLTTQVAEYLAGAADAVLPREVAERAALHTLDTIGAAISGADLDPGRFAGAAWAGLGGPGRSTLVTGGSADPVSAALVNGFAAHADETDDSHPPSTTHPGCAIVPAALALGQHAGIDGTHLLRAIAAGYDVGTRVVMAMRFTEFRSDEAGFSTHGIGGVFGAAAAGAVALRLDAHATRAALALAAQSASGITTWLRDPHHVEKAFVFGGMPASNGVRAALLAQAGLRGVPDVFDTGSNVLSAFSADPDPGELVDGLGERFEVTRTAIKKYAVGSPAQAAVQAAVDLVEAGLRADDIEAVEIVLPRELAQVVDGRALPVINVQYLVAGVLLDGGFSFAMAHDAERMSHPAITGLTARMRLIPDPVLLRERVATLRVTRRDGTVLEQTCSGVRGGPADPMSVDEVLAKVLDLASARSTSAQLAARLLRLDGVADVSALHDLLIPTDREASRR